MRGFGDHHARRGARRRFRRLVTALAGLTLACATTKTGPLERPEFTASRSGVFNDPLPLVENTDDDMMPALAGKSGLIAYVSKQGGNLDIFLRVQDTGAIRRLTTHSSDDVDPAFSPDGKRIAWVAQSADVKGDIWMMHTDGEHKEQLTTRDAAESAPAWSADGTTIYFTTRTSGATGRIDALTLRDKKRTVVVTDGWDPAPASDGTALVYVTADAGGGLPRLYAKRASDGRVAALTDGGAIDALPSFASVAGKPAVVFTRFLDDTTGDGQVDVADTPSLWTIPWDPQIFEGGALASPIPLTPGEGGELLASGAPGWLAYTAAGYADLEVYALPDEGMVRASVPAATVLEAARAESDGGRRRLALRHIIATAPELRGRARYVLASDYAERGKLAEARTELTRAVTELSGGEAGVARIENERLALLQTLGGTWTSELPPAKAVMDQTEAAIAAIVADYPGDAAVAARAANTRAEMTLARGERAKALASFTLIAEPDNVPSEDGARALEHASAIYAIFDDTTAIETVCARLIRRFPAERSSVDRCATTWKDAARDDAGNDPAATLESIARRYHDLPAIAATATYGLGQSQAEYGYADAAITSWQHVVDDYPSARAVTEAALVELSATAERVGNREVALAAYERLLADFSSDPRTRGRAKAGVTRIALAKADDEEVHGDIAEARESYARLLATRRDIAQAHRRYIALSAQLGESQSVIAEYAREAKERPRDAITRYAYGFALTYATPPDLKSAEANVTAALEIDPRLAAAHLTLGWLRDQHEYAQPGRDWLDRAESSYRTALELVDQRDDPQLWAAAQQNRSNALLGLGKNDDAFSGFVARLQSSARFDDRLTELLFYEAFARAAWRTDELATALDMAHQEWLLAQKLPGEPRKATAAALQASINLQAELFSDAVDWYDRAKDLYSAHEDWPRVVPMLRGKALALRNLGRDDEALDAFAALLDLTKRGVGIAKPDKPFFGFLAPEIAANPTNVTRAPYGFTAPQEEEIARAEAARGYRTRGDITRALAFEQRRLALLDSALEDEEMAARIQMELVHALNEFALLDVQVGDTASATLHWNRALDAARASAYFPEAATILESLANLWLRAPESRTPLLATDARAAATAMAEGAKVLDPPSAARFNRWLALERFGDLTHRAPSHDIASGLQALDAANSELDALVSLASQDLDLASHLKGYAAADTAIVPLKEEAPVNFVGPMPEVVTIAQPVVVGWRKAYDDAVAQATHDRVKLDTARLGPAMTAFEQNTGRSDALERDTFLHLAYDALLASNGSERAWLLLERARLTKLAPEKNKFVANKVFKRPILERLSAGTPASLAEVRAALAPGGLLVQAFTLKDGAWIWYVIDEKRLETVVTSAMTDEKFPPAVAKLIGEPAGVVYVDPGSHELPPARTLTVDGKKLPHICEALSASYLAAAYESASFAAEAPTTITQADSETFVRDTRRRLLVRMDAKADVDEPATLVISQPRLWFSTSNGKLESDVIDLDTIATMRLGSAVFWTPGLTPPNQARRAFARALLFAGVPTLITGETPLDSALLISESAEVMYAKAGNDDARYMGYRGLTFEERVDVAFTRLLTLVGPATQSYTKALNSGRRDDWLPARDQMTELVAVLDFLLRPESLTVLRASKRTNAAAYASPVAKKDPKAGADEPDYSMTAVPSLALTALTIRAQLARTEQGVGDIDTAIAIKDGIAQTYEDLGNAPKALSQLLDMGVIYASAERNADAERMLLRCAELAHASKHVANEADCQSRLGSVYKALSQNDKALQSYERAVALYESINNANAPVSRRYLALFYETAANDMDKALALYAKAYDEAAAAKEVRRLPQLQLDIARVYRKRGDYGLALDAITKAQAVIPPAGTVPLKTPDDVANAKWDASNRTDVALETANVQWYRGNYPQAYTEQRSAYAQAFAAYDVPRMIQATSLGGLIAMNQGELDDANTALNSALDLARGSGLRREVAAQLDNLGVVLQSQGKRDQAEANFREALKLDTELANNEGQAFDLRALASVLEKDNRIEESLSTVERALTISRTIGSKYNEAQCLYVKGRALHHSGKLDDATTSFDEAQKLAGNLSIPEVAWRSIYAMGRIAEAKGDPKQARTLFDRALVIAEQLALAGSDASEDESRETLYNDAVRLAIDAKDYAASFRIIERWHGRALLDLVSSSDVALPSDEARGMLASLQREDEAVVTSERELQRGKGSEAQHTSAKANYDAALKKLFASYPGIARTFTIAPRELTETQKALPAKTAVAMYIVNRGQTDVLIIKAASIEHVRIGITSDEVRDLTNRYRIALRAFGEVDALGKSIATALLAPLEPVLGDISHLVIVPQGPLSGMPFAALPYKDGVMLDAMTTSYAPSASVLTDTLNKPKRPVPRRVSATAYGDDLPFARLEALALAGNDALTGPLATETSVRAARAEALDLAVHGDVNDDEPLRASLSFAPTATDDGQLELREVFGMQAAAPLITLSSCTLGTGGPAWQATGSAFIASGAQTVVASHERISDLAAGVLMKRFYRESRSAPSGAEALRAAQRWTRDHFTHPAHWATFALIGDFR